MDISVCILWAISSYTIFIISLLLSDVTLTPKYGRKGMAVRWTAAGVVDFGLVLMSYLIDVYNDIFCILGQPVLLCLVICFLYKESIGKKLFIGLTMPLLATICTFMFCGTTDTFLGAALGLFDPKFGPYTVPNILLFIGLKTVVFTVIYILYRLLLCKRTKMLLQKAQSQMRNYVAAPLVSLISFDIISYVTNSTGIVPTNPYFFLLYVPICMVFVVNYYQIYTSVYWVAEALEANKQVRLDSLTGLGNKMAYFETETATDREIREGKAAFAIVMLDLNYLKVINDRYGHDKGDVAIKTLADIMRKSFDVPGCTLYRIGGDEFSVVLKDESIKKREELIQKFHTAVDSIKSDEPWDKISVAVGYAVYDGSAGQTFQLVYQQADAAMYENKVKMKAVRTI